MFHRGRFGFFKLATHRRPSVEPFFTLGSTALDWGWPKNGPNLAGLLTCQSGPRGSESAKNGQPIWDQFGPIWIPLDHFKQKLIFCSGAALPNPTLSISGKKNHFRLKWSKRAQMGPKGVPNGQKHFGWPFWSLLDPFGPLWSVDRPAMFGHFWSKIDHFWVIPNACRHELQSFLAASSTQNYFLIARMLRFLWHSRQKCRI